MDRITDKHLQAVVDRINRELKQPAAPYAASPNTGLMAAQIGNYHLDYAYGGVSLVRMCNEAGGIATILIRGTKRDLYEHMHAFLMGVAVEKGEK